VVGFAGGGDVSEVAPVAAAAVLGVDRAQVEALLGTLFKLMNYPARLDFQDQPDGALAVAVHFEGDALPGVTPGKRSMLVDSIQFLVNKAINRPNVPRRWVNLGVNAFPEPRQQQPQRREREPAPVAAPASSTPKAQPKPASARSSAPPPPPPRTRPSHPQHAQRSGHTESMADVTPDPVLTALGQALAKKAASLGRVYAVMMLGHDDRARLLTAARATPGLSARAEGEGHWRRVTFMPDKVVPIARKPVMPDYGDGEDEDERGPA
jgi:predicted RNA-binding protein Jag